MDRKYQIKSLILKYNYYVWNRNTGDYSNSLGRSVIFGGKKIPELMKGLGKGVRSFKDGMNNIEKDVNGSEEVSANTEKRNNNG